MDRTREVMYRTEPREGDHLQSQGKTIKIVRRCITSVQNGSFPIRPKPVS